MASLRVEAARRLPMASDKYFLCSCGQSGGLMLGRDREETTKVSMYQRSFHRTVPRETREICLSLRKHLQK